MNPSQPQVVCVTGGIGAGKTTVVQFFKELGTPVYIADERAKALMGSDPEVKKAIITQFGDAAYKGSEPDRAYLANLVFNNSDKLQQLNSIIHPAVERDFKNWLQKQDSPYVIKESAIAIETGAHRQCDLLILVTAPLEERITRVMNRDKVSRDKVLARIKRQLTDEEKIKYADYVIENTDKTLTKYIVYNINNKILNNM